MPPLPDGFPMAASVDSNPRPPELYRRSFSDWSAREDVEARLHEVNFHAQLSGTREGFSLVKLPLKAIWMLIWHRGCTSFWYFL